MTEINHLIYGGEPLTEDIAERWQEIREILQRGPAEVVFVKLDGTLRTMICTLKAGTIPVRETLTEEVVTAPNHTVLNVWETSENDDGSVGQWRSFRVVNVRSVRSL